MTDLNKSFQEAEETISLSSKEKHAFLIKAAQERLLNFCQIIDPVYEAEWFHEILGDVLEDCALAASQGRKKRVILTIPPRSGKSQTASIYFPTWALGKYPNLKFILSTYGADLSEKIGLKARDVMQHEMYQMIYPDIKLRADTKAKANWMTNKSGSYFGVGVGGPVTGTGANCIIFDDPFKNREEAESKTVQEKVWEYYRSTLYSRLEGSGVIILIMQRWNMNDLVSKVLEEDKERLIRGEPTEDWEVINFPAIAEDDEYYKGKIVRKAGDPLWPSKFPLEVLDNIKSTLGIYNWVSQYQQNPIATESQEFKENLFRYFGDSDIEGKYLKYYTIVDPAISQKKNADNTVVLTIAKEISGPNIYRVREDAGKFTPQQTLDLVFKHNSMYKSEVYIETIAYQKALKFSIDEEQKVRQQYFITHEYRSSVEKQLRIRGLIAPYERGIIFHRQTDKDYEIELLQFPRGRHDDRIDAMAIGIEVLSNFSASGGKAKQYIPQSLFFRKKR
jgi:hypothetical protein